MHTRYSRIVLTGVVWVGSTACPAHAVAEDCAKLAIGVQAELRAASSSAWPEATLELVREAARRGCLAAHASATTNTAVTAEAGATASGKNAEGDFMDELLWDLTHDTKGKYKRSRQFK